MIRKGKVISITDDEYKYDIKDGAITLYRYLVVIRLDENQQLVEGKVDSKTAPPGPPEGWSVGLELEFETEEKVTKNNKRYNKFKKPPRENFRGGGKSGWQPKTPEERARINRSVAMQCGIWLHEHGIGKDQALAEIVVKIDLFLASKINEYMSEDANEDNIGMSVSGAIKYAASGAIILGITNFDNFINKAEGVIKYIMNG